VQGANYTYLTGEKIVCQGAAFLHGLILWVSSDGGRVTIYEGQDAGSGRKIATIRAIEDQTKIANMPVKIYCQRGIFITDFSHVDGVTVIWSRPESE